MNITYYSRQILWMNRYSPRRTTQSPLLRHFSDSLRNNSQPSNEVLMREYQFITPIVTEYLIYMTIPLPRTAFVTDSSVFVTISRLAATNLSACNKKRPPDFHLKVSEGWRLPTLPLGIAVPSALTGLTSLFGMGRGGSPSLLPPLFIT